MNGAVGRPEGASGQEEGGEGTPEGALRLLLKALPAPRGGLAPGWRVGSGS